MTVKYIDTYSKKWSVALVRTLSVMYLLFCFPVHVILAGIMYKYIEFYAFQKSDIILGVFVWLSLTLILTFISRTIIKQRKNINMFFSFFKENYFNNLTPANIAKSWTGLNYLALDTRNGTMLYINHPDTTILNFFFPKDIRVMGFGMYDWKSIEVEDNNLTIYTGNPDLPSVLVESSKARQLYEKINAMRNQHWSYEFNIPGYVKYHAEKIADKNGINLILPPK